MPQENKGFIARVRNLFGPKAKDPDQKENKPIVKSPTKKRKVDQVMMPKTDKPEQAPKIGVETGEVTDSLWLSVKTDETKRPDNAVTMPENVVVNAQEQVPTIEQGTVIHEYKDIKFNRGFKTMEEQAVVDNTEPEEKESEEEPEEEEDVTYFTEDQLKAYLYHVYDNNPYINEGEIMMMLARDNIEMEDGSPLHPNRLRGYKYGWVQLHRHQQKQQEQQSQVKEVIMMLCPGCRTKLPETAKFCTNCGFSLLNTPPPQTPPPKAKEEPKEEPKQEIKDLKVEDFRPKQKLQIMIDTFNSARRSGDHVMMQMMGAGIVAEIDKMGSDPNTQLLNTLVMGLVKSKGNQPEVDPITVLEKSANIFSKFQGNQNPEPNSDNVEMAKAITRTIDHGVTELKDGIMQATGGKDVAELFTVCPVCNKPILKDSVICSYCGTEFERQTPQQLYPRYQQQPPQQYYQQPYQSVASPQDSGNMRSVAHPQPTQPTQEPVQQSPVVPKDGPPQHVTPGQMSITPAQRETIKSMSKRLANFIASKRDPVSTVNAAWKFMDDGEKEQVLLAAIIGSERLYYVANKLAPTFPELNNYFQIVTTENGRAWVDLALEAVKNQAREEGLKVKTSRFKQLLVEIEQKIGFEIQ